MAPTDYDSDDEGQELRTDEYGDRFEDYGFIKRAEEHKLMGNADFQKERFEKALKEYECAHDQLLTVAHDKSIVIGKRKWNDVVVMRAMIHLNKSACHYKLKNWSPAADAAQECLMGNVREEMMYTDPTIRAKVKAAEKSHGKSEVAFLEEKLPKGTRSKAWFRLSRCYANLGHLDRAKEALAKAMEHCEDKQTLAEMNQHALRVDTLEKQQKQKQKQQFKGFFEKLQDRGGYVDAKTATKAKWDTLDYNTKLRLIEELDDSDGDDEVLMPVAELLLRVRRREPRRPSYLPRSRRRRAMRPHMPWRMPRIWPSRRTPCMPPKTSRPIVRATPSGERSSGASVRSSRRWTSSRRTSSKRRGSAWLDGSRVPIRRSTTATLISSSAPAIFPLYAC